MLKVDMTNNNNLTDEDDASPYQDSTQPPDNVTRAQFGNAVAYQTHPQSADSTHNKKSVLDRLKAFVKRSSYRNGQNNLREAIEEYIGELRNEEDITSLTHHEHAMISNVLKLRDLNVLDIMVPRADIVAVDINISREEFLSLLSEKQFSRIPVYNTTLDDVVGTIHIKDLLAHLASADTDFQIKDLVREVTIVSPAMPVLDLLLHMRQGSGHMCLVVDEYGGIDGLITVGDVIEAVVGELEDEHESDDDPEFTQRRDGSVIAHARLSIDEFERHYGTILDDSQRDDIDTLGGLIFSIAGRIPARGEVLTDPVTGMVFDIIDADPRRVHRVRVRNIPGSAQDT
jgi:CBS domain containing-hemolysin-like protein